MNIALCNRPETWPGGDMVQLRGYQKTLQKLGHTAVYSPYPIQPQSYDEAWIFHVNFAWAYSNYLRIKKLHIPYKLFPIYYHGLYEGITRDHIEEMLIRSASIYCLSDMEKDELLNDFPIIDNVKIKVIDNGVDKSIFHPSNDEKRFVMSVGRFLPDKGHLEVIDACKTLNLPIIVIGPSCNAEYKKLCESRQGLIEVWPCELEQIELAKLYKKCKVIVCGSYSERNNLAILEGAACGATPVDSIYNRAHTMHNFYKTDPLNPDDLAMAIDCAWKLPMDFSSSILDCSDIVKDILDND